jgi:tungstate transport system ATP-binding protein
MSLLRVRSLRKSFGARLIIELDELQLERGRSYVLTGRNGAGKSTLLRILAGLEAAEIASVHFEGLPIPVDAICAIVAPRIMYLHQHPYLFSTSVAANVGFGLKANAMPHARKIQLVNEAMDWADVHHLAKVPPHKLSGGEKQRVALARARVMNPDVLLLDEPTANLDEEARRQVAGLIKQMCDNNHCIVMATHDPELIAIENSTILRLENKSLNISTPTG